MSYKVASQDTHLTELQRCKSSCENSSGGTMKARIFAHSLSLLPLLSLIACGGGGSTTTAPAAKPQI